MIDPSRPDFTNHPASPKRARYPYLPQSAVPTISVSILTAFFNTDEVFFETAASVLQQSFQEWEWVLVDDGSTSQAALDRLSRVESMDPRIRVFRQENRGPSCARNFAFTKSRAPYVCLLDSDDLIEPTFLEKTIWFLESQPNFAFCNSWSVAFGEQRFLHTTGFEWGQAHVKLNSGPFHSVIRRHAYEAINGFDETIEFGHEDWDFWLAMADAGHWGHTLPEYLEWYRRRETGRHAQIVGVPEAHREFKKLIRKKYGKLESRFPKPQRRIRQPFESVGIKAPFENRLKHNTGESRILFLIPWMVTGGADRVNLDWISCLTREKCQVSICATLSSENEWLPEFSSLTSDVFVLPNFLHAADFPRFIVYLVRSRGIDTVLMSNCTLAYQLLPFLRASCPDVVFVDLAHVEEPRWLNGGHPRFGVGYQDLLDLNIVTTENLRQWMVGAGADKEKIAVCYSGISVGSGDVEAGAKDKLKEALGAPAGVPLLIYAGRICAQKRPAVFATVLKQLADRSVPFHCFVVGEGELLPLLRRRIRQYGLGRSVSLLGKLAHEEWLEALTASDIFFLPSEYEGISVALYEAMSMRVVPVMSAVGGQSEVVLPECGVLVEQNADEVARYVGVLTELISDPERRARMSDAAYRRVADQFSLEKSCAQLRRTLDRAKQLAVSNPRQALPMPLATELAVLALEYSRLSSPEPVPSRVASFLVWARTYKLGRVILRFPWVRRFGKRLLLLPELFGR